MIPISEFQRRSLTGPVMKEEEFNMAVAMKVRELVKRYGIKYNPDEIIVSDETADLVFHAGVDMLAETGIYNKDTFRVIQLTKEEVLSIASEQLAGPGEKIIGRGSDQFTVRRRQPEDTTPVSTLYAASVSAVSTDMFIPYVMSFAQEETCQGFAGMPASLEDVDGLLPKVDTASEVIVALAELRMTLEALRRVGKPDLWIGATYIAASAGGVASLLYPGGMEPHNGQLTIHSMPELKINWSRLVIALLGQERNIEPWTSAAAALGLICRGSEDAAVVSVAALLGQLGYGHGRMTLGGGYDRWGSNSSRKVLWTHSAYRKAVARHIGSIDGMPTPSDAGAGTEMACYERAALTLAGVCSGAGWVFYPAGRMGLGAGHTTGLEGRFMAETAHAVTGMKKEQANELLLKILALYEPNKKDMNVPQGETFFELYDLKTLQPKPYYLDVHKRAKETLSALGLPYTH